MRGFRACAEIDDGEYIGLAEAVPFVVESSADQVAEQWPNFGAGDEVAAPSSLAGQRIEAVLVVVERELDVLGIANGSAVSNSLADQLVQWGEFAGQPPAPRLTISDTSATVSTRPGSTPKTIVASAVRPRAPTSDAGIRIGVRSPSGASSAHMVRSTLR